MQALRGLAILLLLQTAGEGLTRALSLPFPGPVVGLLLLLAALTWPPLRGPVAAAANQLLSHLSLLFVPVGVGVIVHLSVLSAYAGRLMVVITLSTWAGLAATALVTQALMRRFADTPVGSGEAVSEPGADAAQDDALQGDLQTGHGDSGGGMGATVDAPDGAQPAASSSGVPHG